MRNTYKILTAAVVVISVALVWAWPYIAMDFAGSAHYTEQDLREYEFYTPNILKEMPRVSSRYDFDFSNTTGPASQVYAITFYEADRQDAVDAYLSSKGYTKQKDCHIKAVCWRGSDSEETITVSNLKAESIILVSVIYKL